MGSFERDVARRRGRRKLDAMKRRTGELRRRVVATAIVGFVLLWTVVFVQMATGNDPVLGSGTVGRSVAKKRPASTSEQRNLQAATPPPSEEDDEESTAVAEPETSEAERIEVERFEAERREGEARELEELEALSTGQS